MNEQLLGRVEETFLERLDIFVCEKSRRLGDVICF